MVFLYVVGQLTRLRRAHGDEDEHGHEEEDSHGHTEEAATVRQSNVSLAHILVHKPNFSPNSPASGLSTE